MCGIAGLAGPYSAQNAADIVSRMNDAIIHRGPDDSGLWAHDGFAFAMRRLSIIDLAGGHQPMWTEDGVGIVFNGEIYNFRSLRAELEASGYKFSSHSDTEVVLKLYHRDGLSMVHKLEGMFAICLYDPRSRQLHLIRDRFGVKPLYYGVFYGSLYFSSEIKAILAALNSRPALNRQSIHDYLTLRFIPSPHTIWEGISKLRPGHCLSYGLDSQNIQITRYWQLQFNAAQTEPSRDYPREFAQLFLAAVEKRLLAADVPVGVLLSGGLDSSAVAAAAVELGHRDFHTFSVAFEEGGVYDETPFARLVAKHVGARHHEVSIGQREFLDFLPRMVTASDEPLADLASIPLAFVSQLAHRDVKVVLSGEGSDELLAGYNLERLGRLLDRLRTVEYFLPPPVRRALGRLPLSGAIGGWLRLWATNGWQRMLAAKPYHQTLQWLESEKSTLWQGEPPKASTVAQMHNWYEQARGTHPLDQVQQIYSGEWLTEDLLMKADKFSMAASLEVREPFLDHTLAEWAATLPLEWRIGSRPNGYQSKRILRDFCDLRLPQAILDRPKRGFPVPAYQWLSGSLASWSEHLLFRSENGLSSLFHMDMVRPVFAQAKSGNLAAAHKIWTLIVLEYWLEAWQ